MQEKLSQKVLSSYNIELTYSNLNYTNVELNKNKNYLVVGIIEIPKINIKYPILSTVSDELLKIAPCRFYGCYPNEFGNLCIAAHNYDNNSFFSNLHQLNIKDVIYIYDSKNNCISYSVYDKFEVSPNNTSSLSSKTTNNREITLVTCNNITKNRIIVKAKE